MGDLRSFYYLMGPKTNFLARMSNTANEVLTGLQLFKLFLPTFLGNFSKKSMKLHKTILYFFRTCWLNLTIWFRYLCHTLSCMCQNLYYRFKLYEGIFWIRLITHHYSPQQFKPIHVKRNIQLLIRATPCGWVATSKSGALILLLTPWQKKWFKIKNILMLGALQNRVEKVVYFTYVTLTLELNNPFTHRVLLDFLEKKHAFLKRLLTRMQTINDKRWDQSMIYLHLKTYQHSSLLQAYVIEQMHRACAHAKESVIIRKVKQGIKKGIHPLLVTAGMSGSYWMRGQDRAVLGLFKPFDEEIHAPNNPVGPKYQGAMGLRKTRLGCVVGQAAHHEVGAFIVDAYFGFGIVPRTYYACFTHHTFFLTRENRLSSRRIAKTKFGSFQEYAAGFVPLHDLAKQEKEAIALEEFQLLSVLDVIIGNTDRNIGNILVSENAIAAIDHGLCFPDRIDELGYWYWNYFSQADHPLVASLVDLLECFPFAELALKLNKKCFISLDALHRMRERVVLFREGVRAGLCLRDLEPLMYPKYLYPLVERETTLQEYAKEQVDSYTQST